MLWQQDDYQVDTDKARLQLDVIHNFLTQSYWSPGIDLALVQKAIDGSLCFGLYHGDSQVGYARLITDLASFGYLADVFILPEHRGKQLSKWLMDCVMSYPGVDGLRRIMLATRDAHGLYAQYDFKPLTLPERFMEVHRPDIYLATAKEA